MSKRTVYSEEEIQAAWETADPVPGSSPSEIRVDNVLNVGAVLEREKFCTEVTDQHGSGFWQIDDQGRARHAGFRRTEAKSAHGERMRAAAAKQAENQRQRNLLKARTIGLPDGEIFDRLDALENFVAELRNSLLELSRKLRENEQRQMLQRYR